MFIYLFIYFYKFWRGGFTEFALGIHKMVSDLNMLLGARFARFVGLRLTLNIERSEYLDIISPEFGARLLIHPLGTAPTLERGGIILSPGSKSYISIRMVRDKSDVTGTR